MDLDPAVSGSSLKKLQQVENDAVGTTHIVQVDTDMLTMESGGFTISLPNFETMQFTKKSFKVDEEGFLVIYAEIRHAEPGRMSDRSDIAVFKIKDDQVSGEIAFDGTILAITSLGDGFHAVSEKTTASALGLQAPTLAYWIQGGKYPYGSWNSFSGATSYTVYVSSTPNFTNASFYGVTPNTWLPLRVWHTHLYYWVKASNSAGDSPISNMICIWPTEG